MFYTIHWRWLNRLVTFDKSFEYEVTFTRLNISSWKSCSFINTIRRSKCLLTRCIRNLFENFKERTMMIVKECELIFHSSVCLHIFHRFYKQMDEPIVTATPWSIMILEWKELRRSTRVMWVISNGGKRSWNQRVWKKGDKNSWRVWRGFIYIDSRSVI